MKFVLIFIALVFSGQAWAGESTCFGTTSNGSLKDGVALPYQGENFVSYSYIASKIGRTYVHSTVKTIVLDAYQILNQDMPDRKFKYAETGFKEGGEFKPHKTHRNGLSIDFMVPVVNESGQSDYFSTHALNKFGYSVEFDQQGRYDEYRIDYEAMAAHIVALRKAAIKQGVGLWRVIFAPELQRYLFKTQYGDYLKKYIAFSKRRSWVRHDEHYHVDFEVPCEALGSDN